MRLIDSNQRGFTLIELIVVIVILGVLAVVATPRFLTVAREAKIADLTAVSGAMKSGLQMINAKAILAGEDQGAGLILVGGVEIPLYNGYPSVRGSDSFRAINDQVQAWLAIDSVDRNTAFINRDAALFFTDKASSANQIYLFFSSDYGQKSISFGCQIRYENQETSDYQGPSVRVLTDAC